MRLCQLYSLFGSNSGGESGVLFQPVVDLDLVLLDPSLGASGMAETDSTRMVPICIADLEEHAKKVLNKMTFEYYFHGAADEITRVDNLEAFNRYLILFIRNAKSIG
jgi:hypothetical protein